MTGLEGKEFVYLACPYSHPDESVKICRFNRVNKIAGQLMKMGYFVYSPISHSHPIDAACGNQMTHEEHMRQDAAHFIHCELMMVATLDGWDKSKGVKEELGWAKTYDMPVILVHVDGDRITGFSEHEY